MLRNTTAILAILVVLGSSGPSSSALASGSADGGGSRGDVFRSDDFIRVFRNIPRDDYHGHGNRADSMGDRFRRYGNSDVWGHWGGYYGPMIPSV